MSKMGLKTGDLDLDLQGLRHDLDLQGQMAVKIKNKYLQTLAVY